MPNLIPGTPTFKDMDETARLLMMMSGWYETAGGFMYPTMTRMDFYRAFLAEHNGFGANEVSHFWNRYAGTIKVDGSYLVTPTHDYNTGKPLVDSGRITF